MIVVVRVGPLSRGLPLLSRTIVGKTVLRVFLKYEILAILPNYSCLIVKIVKLVPGSLIQGLCVYINPVFLALSIPNSLWLVLEPLTVASGSWSLDSARFWVASYHSLTLLLLL